jgi:tetratricopeptide (TPR) repeat protein
LEVGEKVYAIGAPQGLELTLSEGLISGLREYGSARLIQTTAAISPGSSGGGLFDTQARLVGITTFVVKNGQNLNFALPGEWVSALGFTLNPTTADDSFYEAFLWHEIGHQAGLAGKDEEAVRAYREAIRLMPNAEEAVRPLADSWNNLGLAHDRMKRYEESVKDLRQAIRVDPSYSVPWYNLGIVYFHLAQYQDSIAAYKQCLKLDPNDAEAWNNLGATYGTTGNHRKALAAFETATRLKPDRAESWDGLATAYAAIGELEKASMAQRKLQALRSKVGK